MPLEFFGGLKWIFDCFRQIQGIWNHPVLAQVILHRGQTCPRRPRDPWRSRHRLWLVKTSSKTGSEADLASLDVLVRGPAAGRLSWHGRVPENIFEGRQSAILSGKLTSFLPLSSGIGYLSRYFTTRQKSWPVSTKRTSFITDKLSCLRRHKRLFVWPNYKNFSNRKINLMTFLQKA